MTEIKNHEQDKMASCNNDPFAQFSDSCTRMLKYVEDNSPSEERTQQVIDECIQKSKEKGLASESSQDINQHCQVLYDSSQHAALETLAMLKDLGVNHEPQVTTGPGLLQVKKVEKVIAHAENCTSHIATVDNSKSVLIPEMNNQGVYVSKFRSLPVGEFSLAATPLPDIAMGSPVSTKTHTRSSAPFLSPEQLGTLFRKHRIKTQTDIRYICQFADITKKQLRLFEKGIVTPGFAVILKLFESLGYGRERVLVEMESIKNDSR